MFVRVTQQCVIIIILYYILPHLEFDLDHLPSSPFHRHRLMIEIDHTHTRAERSFRILPNRDRPPDFEKNDFLLTNIVVMCALYYT